MKKFIIHAKHFYHDTIKYSLNFFKMKKKTFKTIFKVLEFLKLILDLIEEIGRFF